MTKESIPIELHPDEIHYTDGANETVWVPGEQNGKFRHWTRFWPRRDATTQEAEEASSLQVNVQPCIHDGQFKLNPFRKKPPVETFDTMYAPIGPGKEMVEVQRTTRSALEGIVVWSADESGDLSRESVAELFPDHVKIERQGNAWVVYEIMQSPEEKREARFRAQQQAAEAEQRKKLIVTRDIVTDEEVLSVPFSGATRENGDFVHQTLEAAAEQAAEGGTVDIHRAVHACDTNGPFRGFLQLFTPQEQASLRTADSTLAAKARDEFYRGCLAHDVNEIIAKTDRAFTAHVEPFIGNIDNPDARASVQRTLDTWRANAANPGRNLFYRSRRKATPEDPQPGRAFAVPTYEQNPAFFAVSKLDASVAGDNIGAGYDPQMCVMLLRQSEGEFHFEDALSAMHEITHKNQHADVLGRSEDRAANHERYVQPIRDSDVQAHGILEEECEAWSNMIELVHARIGFGTFNAMTALSALGTEHPSNAMLHHMEELLLLAQKYYGGGGRKGDEYPPEFVEAIKTSYTRLGVALYVLDEEGFPVPYEEE